MKLKVSKSLHPLVKVKKGLKILLYLHILSKLNPTPVLQKVFNWLLLLHQNFANCNQFLYWLTTIFPSSLGLILIGYYDGSTENTQREVILIDYCLELLGSPRY